MFRFALQLLLVGLLHTVAVMAAPLEVKTISPQGKVPGGARQVVVVFSEPMVALGTADAPNPPVSLIPEPKGRWRWIDTKTLAFEPPGLLPQATLYTVKIPAGTKSWSGNALPEAVVSRFETPPPVLLDPHPGGRMIDNAPGGRKVISLDFNQRVDKEQLAEQIRLVGGGREYRMVQAPARRGERRWQDTAWLRPAESLPPLMDFKMILPAGLRSLEGPLTSKRQEVTFRTPPLLLLTPEEVRPGSITIRASNSLDHDYTGRLSDPSAVTVEPPVPDLKVSSWGDLYLEGSFAVGKTYRVTVSTSLQDEFGQCLDTPRTWALTVPEDEPRRREPALWLGHNGSDLILDPRKPRLPVRSNDVREFEVELRRVKLDEHQRWRSGDKQLGSQIESRVVKTGGLGPRVTEVDLSPALEHGVGHVLVHVKMLPDGDAASGATEWTQWVQVTRLGVTAVQLANTWAVWVASTEDGRPLPLAQVIAGDKVLKVTDGSGYADEIRFPYPHHYEGVVRLGHDSTFVPLQVYPDPGRDFYLAEPQGVYRPGETFRALGLSNPNTMGLIRNADGTLEYEIDNTALRGHTGWGSSGEFELELSLPDLPPGPANLRLLPYDAYSSSAYPIAITNYNPRTGNLLRTPGRKIRPSNYPSQALPRPEVIIEAPHKVRSGEDLVVKIKSPFQNGEGLLWTQNGQLTRFSVRDYKAEVPMQVKEHQFPTLALEAVVAGPAENGECGYARGRFVASMSSADKRIVVEVRPAPSGPNQKSQVDVMLRTDSGQPVSGQVTVMMADEKLRDLTGHRIENPLEAFYPPLPCPLSENWSHRLAPPAEQTELPENEWPEWAVGSAGPSNVGSEKLRDDFRTVPIFETVKVGASGHVTVPFDMPGTLTRYNISAVAVASNGKYGLGEASANIGLPLALEVTAPGSLRVNDTANIGVTAQNGTTHAQRVTYSASADNLELQSPAGMVGVPASESRQFELPATALPGKEAKLRVLANAGAYRDGVEITIPLRDETTDQLVTTRATYGEVPPGGFVLEPVLSPSSGADLEIAVSVNGLFEEWDELRQKLLNGGPTLSLVGLPELIRAMRLESEIDPRQVEANLKVETDKLFEETHLWVTNKDSKVLAAVHGLLKPYQLRSLREELLAEPASGNYQEAREQVLQLAQVGAPQSAEQLRERAVKVTVEEAKSHPTWGPDLTVEQIFPARTSQFQATPSFEPRDLSDGYRVVRRFGPELGAGLEEKYAGLRAENVLHAARIAAAATDKAVPLRVMLDDAVIADEQLGPTGWRQYRAKLTSAASVTIKNGGDKPLYYRLLARARWPETDANPAVVQRTFEAIDDPGDVWLEGDTWHVRRDKVVRVNLVGSRMGLLTERVASGFEIVSIGLQGSNVQGLSVYESSFKAAFTGRESYSVKALISGEFTIPPAFVESQSLPEIWGQSSSQSVVVH